MDGNLGMTQDRAVANRRAMDRLGLDRDSAKEVEGGSVGEALTGAAALVLGILGVIGISPPVLASIGAMCAGVALLLGGGSIAAEAREAFRSRGQSPMRNSVLAGVGLESMAGIAGATLGLLALLGVSRITLLAVAVLVFGTALLMASGATAGLEQFVGPAPDTGRRAYRYASYGASGADVVVGAGAVVLGILALTGTSSLTLVLVALIAVGAATLTTGSTLATRMFTLFK